MGRAVLKLPVNQVQVGQRLPGGYIAREDTATGTVEIEATDLSDAEVAAALSGLVYDPSVMFPDETIRSRAKAALATNATFLALQSPTNTDVVKQVRALTRECNGLIRLALNLLDDTSGT